MALITKRNINDLCPIWTQKVRSGISRTDNKKAAPVTRGSEKDVYFAIEWTAKQLYRFRLD